MSQRLTDAEKVARLRAAIALLLLLPEDPDPLDPAYQNARQVAAGVYQETGE